MNTACLPTQCPRANSPGRGTVFYSPVQTCTYKKTHEKQQFNKHKESPNALCKAKLVLQVHTRNMQRSVHILHKRFFSPVKEINSLFTNNSKITHNYVSIYSIISRLIWLFSYCKQVLFRHYFVWIPDFTLSEFQISISGKTKLVKKAFQNPSVVYNFLFHKIT